MAIPEAARASGGAYRDWLQTRIADPRLDSRTRWTLSDWLSLCRSEARPDAPRVRVITDNADFGDRTVAIPQPAYAPLPTSVGCAATDTPLIGADISGAILYGAGLALLDDALYVDSFRSAPAAWLENGWYILREAVGFHDFDIADMSCVVPEIPADQIRKLSRDREYFLFNSNFGVENFGHFLHDTMAQVHAYDTISALRGRRLTPILRGPLRYPMQEFIFEPLIGPLNEIVYLADGPVRPEVCFSTTRPQHFVEAGQLSFHAMRVLRQRLTQLAHSRPAVGESPRRVYVSRSDGSGGDRQFENIEDAEALLRKFGFATAVASRMTVDETLTMFRDAETVVGVHGAGLMNAMMSARSPQLFEILDYPWSWTSIHMAVTAAGLKAHRLGSLPPRKPGAQPRLDLARISQRNRCIGA